MSTERRRAPRSVSLQSAAWVLVLAQVVHGLTPAPTAAEGVVGTVGGSALLLASGVAAIGINIGHDWAPQLAGWTGIVVAVGFILYHGLPFESSITNPYLGQQVGPPAWLSVIFAVGAGLWAAVEGLVRDRS